ncbi:MAG: MBL fold metallo-hydrolase [Verrucomicrobia bacterium]|jgi:metallo-beta-lactamase family protein|nr:MBL fold metallo-hydrolase [Verrucomicrobiota bacterium]
MSIQITFHGAAGDVTGSAYHIQTDQASVLLDFGMFQGVRQAEERNRVPRGLSPRQLDAVLVTHAHLDHTGRLPLLSRNGYTGPIYCTPATAEVTALILRDSAKVQEQDIARTNRKRERAGQEPLSPLYGAEDVETLIHLLREVPYNQPVPVAPGLKAKFVEAGHILGSASIQLFVQDNGEEKRLVFSGDLGPWNAPILKDPEGFHHAHAVVLESTYGDRDHRPIGATIEEFESLVKAAVEQRGKILIPTFAVGRAQLLIYLLATLFRERTVPPFPVYLDSPMAIEATRIYMNHRELFDEEFEAMRRQRPLAEDLQTLKATPTAQDSMKINDCEGPCMVLAGAGMCNAGRILHHLKQNLWKPETVVIIVGFQAEGSLGRLLVEGEKRVKIFGEQVAVKARVHSLGGFSAHAGRTDLLRWFEPLAATRPRVILTHGETKGRQALCQGIREKHGLDCTLPEYGEMVQM